MLTLPSSRSSRFVCLSVAIVGAWCASIAYAAHVPSAMIREGETIPGDPTGESIFVMNGLAVNHVGGYVAYMNTGTGAGALTAQMWGNVTGGPGALIRSASTFGDYQQDNFESFFGISDAGQIFYSTTCTQISTGLTSRDSVWLDDTLIFVKAEPMPGLPGQFSTFNSRPNMTGNGLMYWLGGYAADTSPTASSVNHALMTGATPSIIIKGSDPIDGGVFQLVTSSSAIGNAYRLSPMGSHIIMSARVTGPAANDTVLFIDYASVMAGGSIVREGFAVPPEIGGLPGENWANFAETGITESGDWIVIGDTSAATTQDHFLMHNGQIILREGQALGAHTLAGANDDAYMNGQGDWAVTWGVAGPSGTLEALIYNGEIVLVEGDNVDWNGDGAIDGNDNNGKLADFFTGVIAVGDRDVNGAVDIYFFGDIDFNGTSSSTDDLLGYFRLTIAPEVTCTLGDVDDDASVTVADVASFVGVLLDPDGATAQELCAADTNDDGAVNGADVATFASCVLNSGCP
ncbi:MAG: hypothetical protein H6818_22025 [Phycisphaerales bacterium]|nr:hypothetical protein [Phycisphaerales bacterium]MCB9862470.1 hypothetical protein [Phycisphaerales bacterium]